MNARAKTTQGRKGRWNRISDLSWKIYRFKGLRELIPCRFLRLANIDQNWQEKYIGPEDTSGYMLKKGFGEIVQQPFLGTGFTVTEVVIGCLAVFFLVLKIGVGGNPVAWIY